MLAMTLMIIMPAVWGLLTGYLLGQNATRR